MYTPAILFAFSGIVVGLGTLFTTEAIFGEMATAGHLWFDCWNVLLQGGWTLFNQMPLLFCVALPISLANKQNARCCMEALAIYLTFNYFVSTILGQWGPVFGVDYSVEAGSGTGLATIASIKTLDMGIMGALIISGIATMLHNKFFDTELPEWLGVFSGSVFIYMIGSSLWFRSLLSPAWCGRMFRLLSLPSRDSSFPPVRLAWVSLLSSSAC